MASAAPSPPSQSQPPKPPSRKDVAAHLNFYTAFRNYVQHEDNLTNNRLNWNFTIQGFLFLSWAYCLQKISDLNIAYYNPNKGLSQSAKDGLQLTLKQVQAAEKLIGLMGFFVSLAILVATIAAQRALFAIEKKWHDGVGWEYQSKVDKSDTHGRDLPGLFGGGSSLAKWLGLSPVLIPLFFLAAWVLLLRAS